jgi:hypothetical protein
MLERLLKFSAAVGEEPVAPPSAVMKPERPAEPALAPVQYPKPIPATAHAGPFSPGQFASFEDIYGSGAGRYPSTAYGVLKVIEMVNSQHVAGLSAEAKRCSLMMALEAADARVEDILQDAMLRQRALNDYEQSLERQLKTFEASKVSENDAIQTELNRFTEECLRRIQANVDEVARQEEQLHSWVKRKQAESQRIADAVALCAAPSNPGSGANVCNVVARIGTELSAPRR